MLWLLMIREQCLSALEVVARKEAGGSECRRP
uniref:Uncharacterized protein n=1 Tax=Anguilla anguilla TaxID=7936 RepID=A0A0E9TVR1_ANGAN